MKYNHALAEKKFREEWRIKLRFYRKNGMTLEQILPLYKMDKAELRGNRCYYEHTEPLIDAECNLRIAEMPVLTKYDEFNWTDVLPDELMQQLSVLPANWLRAFYYYRVCGYTQSDISVILSIPQRTISRYVGKIAEIIEDFSESG